MAKPTDQELDISVAAMLRFGVILSALVVLAGGLLFLWHPWSAIPDYSHFRAGDSSLRTISGIVRGSVRLSPRSIIQLGLILLMPRLSRGSRFVWSALPGSEAACMC